jgi:hypothetical protein
MLLLATENDEDEIVDLLGSQNGSKPSKNVQAKQQQKKPPMRGSTQKGKQKSLLSG